MLSPLDDIDSKDEGDVSANATAAVKKEEDKHNKDKAFTNMSTDFDRIKSNAINLNKFKSNFAQFCSLLGIRTEKTVIFKTEVNRLMAMQIGPHGDKITLALTIDNWLKDQTKLEPADAKTSVAEASAVTTPATSCRGEARNQPMAYNPHRNLRAHRSPQIAQMMLNIDATHLLFRV